MSSTLRLSRTLASSSRVSLTQRPFHTSRIARDHFLDVDAAGFQKRALDATNSKPVLVDFYARVLTPLLKSVTGPESGFDLVTIDVDQHPEVAGEYKISALPTVVAFKDGKVKNKFVGFRNEADVKKFLGML
ncbi:hypothetical protein EHS25_004391 [Saitozyma podzolica]|uniref:Thioredoxin domain-containing protein n=1 Tax=Saitozyma podzolica TaxID=1890683 RepID=A0A427YU18_9TREE|nr:hypothetical protein EHS25_004391 [Saitozyma podzolica]